MAYALWNLIQGASQPSGITFGFSLVLGLVILAVIEHVLLFLPCQPQRLWSWALRSDASIIRERIG
jgi:hypothetical protein